MIPDHYHYVEPYFGSGALFFAKDRSPYETINDVDSDVMNFWTVLRDRLDEFVALAQFTQHSWELWDECRRLYKEEACPVRRAWRWWVVARQSRNGCWGRSWAWSRGKPGNRTYVARKLLHSVRDLPQFAERLQGASIEWRDGVDVMRSYCTAHTFVYCDPPYVDETRTDLQLYRNELTMFAHEELVSLLLDLPGKFMLSGYRHAAYEPLETAGWTRLDLPAVLPVLVATRREGEYVTESIWLDPITAKEVRASEVQLASKCNKATEAVQSSKGEAGGGRPGARRRRRMRA